jgi:hypothetical protein
MTLELFFTIIQQIFIEHLGKKREASEDIFLETDRNSTLGN